MEIDTGIKEDYATSIKHFDRRRGYVLGESMMGRRLHVSEIKDEI
jgi:hypothetical protein